MNVQLSPRSDRFEGPGDAGGFGGRRTIRVWIVAAAIVGMLSWTVARRLSARPDMGRPSAFAQAVDLSPLSRVAVHTEGRLKSFDSFADQMTRYVSGPHRVNGQSAAFTYFDLMFRPDRYERADVVFVKSKPLRMLIAQRLSGRLDGARLARFERTGLLSPEVLLGDHEVHGLLVRLSRDAVRTAKHVEQIETALHVRTPALLTENLRVIPPAGAGASAMTPWTGIAMLGVPPPGAPADAAHGADPHAGHDHPPGVEHDHPVGAATPIPGMDPAQQAALADAWRDFSQGWAAEDAARVNAAAARLDVLLHEVNPALYPARERLAWESRYFQMNNFTWVWLIYFASVALLLMGIVYRWRPARLAGVGFFMLAFGLHTASLALRWYVSGRWPNSNMFEAVTTAAWFGGAFALLFEPLARRSPMRGLFYLTSSAASMTALMAADFLPLQLNPSIGNKMPVLHDVWLYIHTNVIIFSYVLIAMAAGTATLYLLWRLGGGRPDYAKAGGVAMLLASSGAKAAPGGGMKKGRAAEIAERRASAGEVFDGATMILMELSFVLLWAGTVMGAIWADHSWGRPWGWDPKEVFALATFAIYAILIHVRIKVRDKGLWTAWLAILGCAVMIFNWTVINFVITGLHSYA